MSDDLLGGSGSLMKGLSGFMPQDVKLLNARAGNCFRGGCGRKQGG